MMSIPQCLGLAPIPLKDLTGIKVTEKPKTGQKPKAGSYVPPPYPTEPAPPPEQPDI
jgi:hypothetical protein